MIVVASSERPLSASNLRIIGEEQGISVLSGPYWSNEKHQSLVVAYLCQSLG